MAPRVFTVEEANQLLPRMERVLEELQDLRGEMQSASEQLQILDALWGEAVRLPDNPDHRDYLEHRKRIRTLVDGLEVKIQEEIADRGIRFPAGGLENGLLDFPTSYRGRWVYLCWQKGEPEIRKWHEIHAGYRGRRDLTEKQAGVMGIEDDPDDLDPSLLDFL